MSGLLFQLAQSDLDRVLQHRLRSPLVEVIASLYAANDHQRDTLIRYHTGQLSSLLSKCCKGEIRPSSNDLQEQISKIVPAGGRTYLYVHAPEHPSPDQRISIEQSTDGLWCVTSKRAKVVDFDHPKAGVVIRFPWLVEEGPVAEKVFAGSSDIRDFSSEVLRSYETRRDLSHCGLVADLFGAFRNNTLIVRARKGKCSFTLNLRPELELATKGFVEPFDFKLGSLQLYSALVTKPRIILRLDTTARCLGQKSRRRAVLPQIKDAEAYIPPRRNQGQISDEQILVEQIVYNRLLPMIGIDRGNGRVNILGLSFVPASGVASVVVFAKDRLRSRCESIPVLTLIDGNKIWKPNQRARTLFDLRPHPG
jgi:hypothetical protein